MKKLRDIDLGDIIVMILALIAVIFITLIVLNKIELIWALSIITQIFALLVGTVILICFHSFGIWYYETMKKNIIYLIKK